MNDLTTTTPIQAANRYLLLTILLTIAVVAIVLSSCMQVETLWAAPKLGVVVDEKLKVVDIDAGSPAEQVGIQKGDVLISIGGVPFTEKEKADAIIQAFPGEAAYEALAEGKAWQVKVWPLVLERNGEKIAVQIMPAPLTWWGRSPLPTPTPMNPEEPFDYL